VSEFLHEQVDFGIQDWASGGRLVGFTGRPVKGTLEQQRRQHLILLEAIYGKEVNVWMPECV
jgi:hypothetical protein